MEKILRNFEQSQRKKELRFLIRFQKYGHSIALSRWIGIAVPALFFITVFLFSHFQKVFQYDPDEGIAVMTALLHSKGHILYKEIWLDQPPFFVLLLSSFFKLFGPSVLLARSVVLALSSFLLWASGMRYSRIITG